MSTGEIGLGGLANVDAELPSRAVAPKAGAIAAPAAIPTSVIGKVASPPRHEATSEEFCFWVSPGMLVEKTQIVRTDSTVAGRAIRFYGLVKEVYRESRQAHIAEEYDRFDGDVSYEPPYESRGVTYAVVSILRTVPPVLAPPMEGSLVHLGGAEDACKAYNGDEIEHPMAVGLVRNGGEKFAGPGAIDLDYLLGANGGHLNVTGVAGRGTKSSFLLHVNYLLLHEARQQQRERPSDPRRLRVVPIILNVKNFDLFHIDRRHRKFDPAVHGPEWRQLKIESPAPFSNVRFYAPQLPGDSTNPRDTGRPRADVKAYSWSLSDVIERGLLPYLFAEEDVRDANFGALVLDLEQWLTEDHQDLRTGERSRRLRDIDRPQTFGELLERFRDWATDSTTRPLQNHHEGTWRKLYRRVLKLVLEGDGVLRRDQLHGKPLSLTAHDIQDPSVVDLSSLAAVPSLQRFVVATIFRQLVEDRTGSAAQAGLIYLVTLDELNRFALGVATDVLLICGDLFEQGRADVLRYWIDQLNQMFASFLRGGGTILAITGNHDNENVAQVLHQTMKLAAPVPTEKGGQVALGRFHLFTGPTFFHLTDRDGCKVQFVALPSPTHSRYLKAEEAQAYQGIDERNRALKTAYVSTLQGIFAHPKFDKTCPTVLAAHILTTGAEVRNGVKLTDGEGIVMRDAELPTHLAYVAMGDIHKPQSLLNLNHVRYCGSLDRMDVGESGEEKGVIVVDIGRKDRIGDPRWLPIASTPIYYVEINEPATEVPELIEKYADHEHALVKLMLRYRAGRDDLNGLLAELERIFPRCYDRDWQEISGGENNGDGVGAGSHQNHTVRQTVMEYLQAQLDGDTEREEIIRLAEELVTRHEQQ